MFEQLETHYNAYLIFSNIMAVLLFCCLDKLLRHFINFKKQECYYLMHSIFNIFVSIYCFPVVVYSVLNLDKIMGLSYTFIGNVIASFHIYHIISYHSQFKQIDWSHHIVAFVSIYFCIWKGIIGASGIIVAFFMCGFPGIMYYFPLLLSVKNIISRETQKKINFWFSFPRCVGILYGTAISIILWSIGHAPLFSAYDMTFVVSMNVWNAMYFHHVVVIDYYVNDKINTFTDASAESKNKLDNNTDDDNDNDKSVRTKGYSFFDNFAVCPYIKRS